MRGDMTRRSAMAGMGAAAAVATSGAALALPGTVAAQGASSLSLDLIWTLYHGIKPGEPIPKAGDLVTLREEREPYLNQAIVAYAQSGEQLGFIPHDHAASVAEAMQRGDWVEARIAAREETIVYGTYTSGWSVPSLDLRIVPMTLV